MSFRNWFFKISKAEAMCDEILDKMKELENDMLRVEMKIVEGRRVGSDVFQYEQIYAQYAALRDEMRRQLDFWLQIWQSEQG